MKLRLQTNDGAWKAFDYDVREQSPGALTEIYVPAFLGTWLVGAGGMTANIGGNDWRIYTIHPDDCAAICPPLTAAPTATAANNDGHESAGGL